MKHKRYIIGGLVVCLAIGYIVYLLIGSAIPYYSTVSELKESGKSVYGESVRVMGDVVTDSIDYNTENLTFIITDGDESLNVVYEGKTGDIPDTFGDQTQVVLEGKLDSSWTFHVSSILTKCPSKYESG